MGSLRGEHSRYCARIPLPDIEIRGRVIANHPSKPHEAVDRRRVLNDMIAAEPDGIVRKYPRWIKDLKAAPPGKTGAQARWRAFPKLRAPDILASNFFCVRTILFQTLDPFFVLAVERVDDRRGYER